MSLIDKLLFESIKTQLCHFSLRGQQFVTGWTNHRRVLLWNQVGGDGKGVVEGKERTLLLPLTE